MAALIEADGLRKRFGKVTALDGLELTLPEGQAVAVLGPNGAGKTTFIRMVATLLEPDGGTLYVDGHDVVRDAHGRPAHDRARRPVRRRRGDDDGRENLVMVARLYGQSAARPRPARAGSSSR